MKIKIRRDFLQKRKSLDKNIIDEAKNEVYDIIKKSFISQKKIVMSYISHDNEINLELFNETHSHIYIPYIDEQNLINAAKFGPLIKGKYGIWVPKNKKFINKETIEICLVPGIAFNKFGNRIGYGYGYYDKFLKGTNIIKIGCCYEWQLINDFTTEAHDIKMNYILTEKRLINVN